MYIEQDMKVEYSIFEFSEFKKLMNDLVSNGWVHYETEYIDNQNGAVKLRKSESI